MKKFDIKARAKNYIVYIGILGVVLASVNVDINSLTSWQIVVEVAKDIIFNPVKLIGFTGAIAGVLADTSTKGFFDNKSE